jgi:hypothetical protein
MLIGSIHQDNIEKLLRSVEFGWRYNPNTYGREIENIPAHMYDSPQLTHVMYFDNAVLTDGVYWQAVQPILDKLNPTEIFKVKANLLFPHHNPKNYHIPHCDLDVSGWKSCIYYVNDSDGDTVLFDKYYQLGDADLKIAHRETPEKGRAIVFDSDRYHSSNNPKTHSERIVFNIVYR